MDDSRAIVDSGSGRKSALLCGGKGRSCSRFDGRSNSASPPGVRSDPVRHPPKEDRREKSFWKSATWNTKEWEE